MSPVVVSSNLPPRFGQRRSSYPASPLYLVPNQTISVASTPSGTVQRRHSTAANGAAETRSAYADEDSRQEATVASISSSLRTPHKTRPSKQLHHQSPSIRPSPSTHSPGVPRGDPGIHTFRKSILSLRSSTPAKSLGVPKWKRRVTFSPQVTEFPHDGRMRPRRKSFHAGSSKMSSEATFKAMTLLRRQTPFSPLARTVSAAKTVPNVPSYHIPNVTSTQASPAQASPTGSRKRGRPKGSKNKPKLSISRDADAIVALESGSSSSPKSQTNSVPTPVAEIPQGQGLEIDQSPTKKNVGRPKGSKNKSTLARERESQQEPSIPRKRKASEDATPQSGWTLNLETLRWERVPPKTPPSKVGPVTRSHPASPTTASFSSPVTAIPIPSSLLAKALLFEPRTEYQTKSLALEAIAHAFGSYRQAHRVSVTPWQPTGDKLVTSRRINMGSSWIIIANPETFNADVKKLEKEMKKIAREVVSASAEPMPIDHKAVTCNVTRLSKSAVRVTGRCQCSFSIAPPGSEGTVPTCGGIVTVTTTEEPATQFSVMVSAARYAVVVVHP